MTSAAAEPTRAPRVSIGMPVYNSQRYVGEAIESALAQTFMDFELVICDNASSDRTQAIVKAYGARDPRVRYYRNPQNLGAAKNCNRTFDLSRGEYFRWLASDDLMEPRCLEASVQALDATPEAVLAYTHWRKIDGDGNVLADCQNDVPLADQKDVGRRFQLLRDLPGRPHGPWPMLYFYGVIRAAALRRTRLTGCYINGDACLVFELLLRGPFLALPERLTVFRDHKESYTTFARDDATKLPYYNTAPSPLSRLLGSRRLYFEYLVALARAPLSPLDRLNLAYHHVAWRLSSLVHKFGNV